jgi:hypothetical protein
VKAGIHNSGRPKAAGLAPFSVAAARPSRMMQTASVAASEAAAGQSSGTTPLRPTLGAGRQLAGTPAAGLTATPALAAASAQHMHLITID